MVIKNINPLGKIDEVSEPMGSFNYRYFIQFSISGTKSEKKDIMDYCNEKQQDETEFHIRCLKQGWKEVIKKTIDESMKEVDLNGGDIRGTLIKLAKREGYKINDIIRKGRKEIWKKEKFLK